MSDHSYLPTRFGGLVENALDYIGGFVVRQILQKLSCVVCHWSLVRDAVPSSFGKNFNLLTPEKQRRPSDSITRYSEGLILLSFFFFYLLVFEY